MAQKSTKTKQIETLRHDEARRPYIPTAEYESVVAAEIKTPIQVAYERRNPDLDPQLVWRGKDLLDWSDLVVPAPPLYIQEKVHPKVLVDDLLRQSRERAAATAAEADAPVQLDMFADFNGIPAGATGTEFYRHDANWTNRLILGDSLQVMASLAEREGLRGQVQCIYIDPPYGIKFNSNFQWSTTDRDVKDGKSDHITREPEQVKAFRDTWRDGIHSYLTYLRDRFIVARDLLHESGSLFVQIGDENLHLIKGLLEEVFGEQNYVNTIVIKKKGSTLVTESVFDFILWFCRSRESLKVRRPLEFRRDPEEDTKFNTLVSPDGQMVRVKELTALRKADMLNAGWRWARVNFPIVSQHPQEIRSRDYVFRGKLRSCGVNRQWSFDHPAGLNRLAYADRLYDAGGSSLGGVVFHTDRPSVAVSNLWDDVKGEENPVYVVQTAWRVAQRCILMTTDPGDLVLDPTCGSGTTAYVAEQWGRRWITIDTSRVALALARARIMGARYPYYLLADSKAGQAKEAELRGALPSSQPTFGDIRHGFVYERVPHITLKSIANNAAIDVIWETYQAQMEPLRAEINRLAGEAWEEWEMPRDLTGLGDLSGLAERWWALRIERQRAIDASIAAAAEQEFLYDKPYQDKSIVRVAGPFTVESLSPHRVLTVNADDELVDTGRGNLFREPPPAYDGDGPDFAAVILESLRVAGVQQAHKADRITFTALTPWPGHYISGEGTYLEAETGQERRAGIFIGPEFGTVARVDLVAAAREAGDAGFDVLIACAFNYDAHSSEFERLGRIPILKARMNADLHMAGSLADTGAGNLFVIFGEPDIEIRPAGDGQIEVEIRGVDVFHPQSGEVRSAGPEGIACWFIDTDYNEESFFVRHAYFLGMNDPYGALRTTLKAEIDEAAWESLYRAVSRPFPRPTTGRIAVKVINHLGDEVMKVYSVQ